MLKKKEQKKIALAIFESRLKALGEDKIMDIYSCQADDYQTNDYEYEDLMEQFCDNFREIVLASIEVDESQYSKVVRQFYNMIELSDDGNDEFVYDSTFWNFLTKFDDSPKYEYLK